MRGRFRGQREESKWKKKGDAKVRARSTGDCSVSLKWLASACLFDSRISCSLVSQDTHSILISRNTRSNDLLFTRQGKDSRRIFLTVFGILSNRKLAFVGTSATSMLYTC